jgi:hypothetical protein
LSTTTRTSFVFTGYGLNYLIDIEYAVIVDVEAAPARTYDELAATKMMIEGAEETRARLQ